MAPSKYGVVPKPEASDREAMLLHALQRIANCSASDLMKYCRYVDSVAIDALVEYDCGE